MIHHTYKENDFSFFLKQRAASYIKNSSENMEINDQDQMPDDFNLVDFDKFLTTLENGINDQNIDNIITAETNIFYFFQKFYDLLDSKPALFSLLDILQGHNFLIVLYNMIVNIKHPVIISKILEIAKIALSFNENHPFLNGENCCNIDILDKLAEIAISPQITETQESQNKLNFGNVTLSSTFGTVYNMDVRLYNSIQYLAIDVITNISFHRHSFILRDFYVVGPNLYKEFFNQNQESSLSLLKSINNDTFESLLYLFMTVTAFVNDAITEYEMLPFFNTFLYAIVSQSNDNFLEFSLYGMIESIKQQCNVTNYMSETPLFDRLSLLLKSNNEKIASNSLCCITEILSKADRKVKESLLNKLNWKDIALFGCQSKEERSLIFFCKAIMNISNHCIDTIDNMEKEGIFKILLDIAFNSSYNMKVHALKTIVKCITLIQTSTLDELLENGLAESLADVLTNLSDNDAIEFIDAFEFILTVGTSTRIIVHLFKEGLANQLLEELDLLQNVDNNVLLEKAAKLYNTFLIAQREFEESSLGVS